MGRRRAGEQSSREEQGTNRHGGGFLDQSPRRAALRFTGPILVQGVLSDLGRGADGCLIGVGGKRVMDCHVNHFQIASHNRRGERGAGFGFGVEKSCVGGERKCAQHRPRHSDEEL